MAAAVMICWLAAPSIHAAGRTLTFEERVEAQRAIERVYHSHQIGAAEPFESAVPRPALEAKVRAYLRKSVALEEVWRSPITAEALSREAARIARRTRFPDRLREIYDALGGDAFLVQECFARPVLVDRLVRGFFAAGGRGARPGTEEGEPRADEESPGASAPGAEAAWDAWWAEIEGSLDPARAAAVASLDARLPEPRAAAEAAAAARNKRGEWSAGLLDDVPAERDGDTAVWTGTEMIVWGGADAAHGELANTGARYDPVTDTWEGISLAKAPEPRSGHVAVWTGAEMIVWGGFSKGSFLAGGGRYDPATDSWRPMSRARAPAQRFDHTAVWTGSEMIVWGGFNGSYLKTGGRYDPATDTWSGTSVAGAPTGRFGHTAAWAGGVMVVWGGFRGGHLDSGGRYDPATNTWAPTSTLDAPSPRIDHTAVWTGSRMIVWGGRRGRPLATGGQYDPVADSWAPTSGAGAPPARGGHAAVWTGSRMIVLSEDAPVQTWAYQYDPAGDAWVRSASSLRMYNSGNASAVWTGGEMIVWQGVAPHHPGESGGRYNPFLDVWTPTATTNAPESRWHHTAVWTGSLMIVWGGQEDISPYNGVMTGARYDPLLHAWTPVSTLGAPEGRFFHTAVWTGSRMIVWGGVNDAVAGLPLDTGGSYDPVGDSWAPTSIVNVPLPRSRHTAVWTGSLMIVWEGATGTNVPTGGRYDPASDSWTPTSSVDAPQARIGHTAIWTGTEMIVWGGQSSQPPYYLRSGGRYDPVVDAWTPTPTTGAPKPRAYHTGVWTGDEMVVWGGDPDRAVDTGGRYDPRTDRWRTVSTSNAPRSVVLHTAVWTGTEMIIWGGHPLDQFSFPTSVNEGGRYDPSRDAWTRTATRGAPAGRIDHTAVWTGTDMIVWGGDHSFGGTFALYDGGAYTPP